MSTSPPAKPSPDRRPANCSTSCVPPSQTSTSVNVVPVAPSPASRATSPNDCWTSTMSPADELPDRPSGGHGRRGDDGGEEVGDDGAREVGDDGAREVGDDGEPTPSELDRARAKALRRTVLRKSMRHDRARQRRQQSTWSFLGTFGLVGWTVALPTLLGLALGVFLDDVTDSERSFTLTFLLAGVAVGCATAWYWVEQERRPDDD